MTKRTSDHEDVHDDDELVELADSIADGRPVRWRELSDSLPSGEAKELLAPLRVIADVAAAHRSEEYTAPRSAETTARAPLTEWGELKLLEKIGEGSHAEVFRAVDEKLEREVALKLLHPRSGPSDAAFATIAQEGKHLAKLKHPNIATVYGVDEHDGRVGIWMELVPGRTLRELVGERGALGASEAALVGIEIAKAAAALHAKGLVHRDIKASNVIREQGGRFVLADFGIVSQADAEGDGGTPRGTPLYMPPEVLAGGSANRATDIYSIGVLLYFLVSETYPVDAHNLEGLRDAHAKRERRLLREQRPDLPRSFTRVVDRALSPNPDDRFSTVAELEDALLECLAVEDRPRGAGSERVRWRRKWLGAVAAVALALAAGALYLRSPGSNLSIRIDRVTPLTSSPGLEEEPSWSPDGTRITYAADRAGNMDVWVRRVGFGESINLTADHAGFDGNPVWAPDGERIAFLSDRDGGGIFVMPSVGGAPRLAVRLEFSPMVSFCWSPDGARLAYGSRLASSGDDARSGLNVVDVDGGSRHEIVPPGTAWALSDPAWSARTNRIAYTALTGGTTGSAGTTVSAIWTVDPDGGNRAQMTDGEFFEHSPAWSRDGRRLFFVSNRSGNHDVWWMRVDSAGGASGEPSQLTSDAGVGGFALSPDDTSLVYTRLSQRANIWSIPKGSETALSLADATPITNETHLVGGFDTTADGEWIVFDSDRAGTVGVWLAKSDGSEMRVLTDESSNAWNPRFSPNEKQVAFHALLSGNRDIVTTTLAGGIDWRLTTDPAEDGWPYWSPDGSEIVFMSNRTEERFDLWVTPAAGGELRRLTSGGGQFPVWSADGDQIVFTSERQGNAELYVVPAGGGEERPLTNAGWQAVVPGVWTDDGATIYAFGINGNDSEGYALWAVDAASGAARVILKVDESGKQVTWGLAGNDPSIYFALVEKTGDLRIADMAWVPSPS